MSLKEKKAIDMAGKKRWSADELEVLKKRYLTAPIEEVVKLLPGRSKDAIQWKASQLGLLIRNGKQINAEYKLIINLTERHYEFLKNKRNQSRVIREALDMYMESK